MANKKNLNKLTHLQSNDSKDYSSFKVVLFYCMLIIFFPVVTFFSIKTLVCDIFLNLEPIRGNTYSAISAVVALHVALGIYIYRAYFAAEVSSPEAVKKQD